MGCALAGENVVLRSGFQIAASRHEVDGAILKLHVGGGIVEIRASEVDRIEVVEDAPVPAIPPPPKADPPPAPAPTPRQLVERAAEKWGLPAEFLHSVARVESGYRADAVSPKGAIGIMQLMPGTAALLEADPRDPEQNVDAGARHLRDLLLLYNGESGKALAAYNAGAGAVDRYRGIPPYAETQLYVQKVLRQYQQLTKEPRQ